MVIDATAKGRHNVALDLAKRLKNGEVFDMEGNFPDYFKVAAANNTIARLLYYLLPPNVMQDLIEQTPAADFELLGDEIIMYWYDDSIASEMTPDWELFFARAQQMYASVVTELLSYIDKYKVGDEARAPEWSQPLELTQLSQSEEFTFVQQLVYAYGKNFMSTNRRLLYMSRLLTVGIVVGTLAILFVSMIVGYLVAFPGGRLF